MRAEIEKDYKIKCKHELLYYKPCSEEHEHEYEIKINIYAWMNEESGMVFNYKDLDEVVGKYEGKNLNDLMEIPTVENFALAIADDIIAKIQHYSRITVTIQESENTKVTIVR